jgi:regulator of ribonuclease activity A
MSTEFVAPEKLEIRATSDVCDEYGESALVPDGILWKNYGGTKKYCGYAVTMKCSDDNTWVKEMIESSIGEGKVLVIDAGGNTKSASLGGNIGAMAVENKWEGIVLFGSVRDVDELAALDIGVHAIGHVPKKGEGKTNRTGQAGDTVSIGTLSVASGDKVYADSDGVVFLKA